ncbi:membrane protein [Streptomycetaceae bacterium MP113-05]|nr:membrane protein [Streptomycetaceae bacterium MP113-05]
MLTPLTVTLAVAALLLAAWCGHAAYRDQPTKDWHFIGMAVVTLLAVAQLVIGVVRLATGSVPAGGTAVFVSYLVGVVCCLPVVGVVSLSERTRWGSITVAAGAVVLAVLQARLHEVWGGGGA